MGITQLVLDADGLNLALPESHKGGYTASREPQAVDVEMISGRVVRELRGSVVHVSYQYGYFDDEMKTRFLAACEKGRGTPITCGVLFPGSTELVYSRYWVTSIGYPKFMWSRDGTPLWADFRVELQEVEPSA